MVARALAFRVALTGFVATLGPDWAGTGMKTFGKPRLWGRPFYFQVF